MRTPPHSKIDHEVSRRAPSQIIGARRRSREKMIYKKRRLLLRPPKVEFRGGRFWDTLVVGPGDDEVNCLVGAAALAGDALRIPQGNYRLARNWNSCASL